MKYIDIRTQFKSTDLIDIRNVINIFGHIDRRRLYEWQKCNYIKKITNNFYIFSDADINDNMLKMIATKIYQPSYIGLETALSFYNLIPEAVFQITAISTRKTRTIQTKIANFKYRSICKKLFWGYKLYKDKTHSFFMSDPEKTLLDYLYLNPHINCKSAFKSLRLSINEFQKTINLTKLKKYLSIFNRKSLTKTVKDLLRIFDVAF